MEFGGADSLFALANLLNPPSQRIDDIDDDDDDIKAPRGLGGAAFKSPGDISLSKEEKRDLKRQERTKNSGNSTNTKDIWDADEVGPSQEFDDVYDPREQPEYSIAYRQSVTTDDVYLGFGNKTPSTASCETMVVRIVLPNSKSANDIELNVKKTFLDCRTSTHRLGLHLPHPVDDKSAKAQWNSAKHELSISLRMVRELDDLNM